MGKIRQFSEKCKGSVYISKVTLGQLFIGLMHNDISE